MGLAVVEIILDGKGFQFPLHRIKQTKPKYGAGAISALYGISHHCPSFQRSLKKGPWDIPRVGGAPSFIRTRMISMI